MRYKLHIAYDGTDYHGWQIQPHAKTIAGTLQSTFYKAFRAPCILLGASRTDAGVHAMGQIAICRTSLNLPSEKILYAWNNILSGDISIRSLESISNDFHPFKNVYYKTYHYSVYTEQPSPFVKRYGHFHNLPLDSKKLEEALNVFVGTHDFRSFCTGNEMWPDTIRTIDSVQIQHFQHLNLIKIEIRGPSFLRYMIRRIVGACLKVASNPKLSTEILKTALASKDPRQNFPTAPAKGLLLYKIVYKDKKNEATY